MEEALGAFLRAAGLDPATQPGLEGTPALAARAWRDEFLDGYGEDPSEILAERFERGDRDRGELVVVTGIDYESVCPHHLLPYSGVAHIGYVPGRHVVGFGQLTRLLRCFGHRLVLQEDLAKDVADALVGLLEARAAGVILVAKQACLTLRGGRKSRAEVVAEAFAGTLAAEGELRARFLSHVAKSGRGR
jgi:GTP cyclohydrolase I